LHIAWRQEAVS